MKPLSSDTDPKTQALLIGGYRAMTAPQKLKRITELTQGVQQLALARIRRQYPQSSEREQQLRLASLWLPPETMKKVFDWDPAKEGY